MFPRYLSRREWQLVTQAYHASGEFDLERTRLKPLSELDFPHVPARGRGLSLRSLRSSRTGVLKPMFVFLAEYCRCFGFLGFLPRYLLTASVV